MAKIDQKKLKQALYKLREFNPSSIVYIATGGELLAQELASNLTLPLFSFDIRYPYSRFIEKVPLFFMPVFWLFKEIIYRISTPVLKRNLFQGHIKNKIEVPVILVDDSIGSGKTVKIALDELYSLGIMRNDIYIITLKCSKKREYLADLILQDLIHLE